MSEEEWKKKLLEEGYKILGIHTFEIDEKGDEHTHDEATVHVILEGDLIIQDKNGEERVYHAGERFNIAQGTTHTVTPGPLGCRMIVAVKNTVN